MVGGSYGGLGTTNGNSSDKTNTTYGDYRNPADFGTGGTGSPSANGAGGGLVLITTGSAQIDGAILADGNPGAVNGYATGAGGSGGGLSLQVTGTLSGAGQIAADGGAANNTYGLQGAGGGGRVAVTYGSLTGFDLSKVTALGGGVHPAGVGTVYLVKAGSAGQLFIDSHGNPTGASTPLGQAGDTVFSPESDDFWGRRGGVTL